MQGISILICCYNSEKIIAENLQHVQNQNVEGVNWEVILVNNNSSDNTVKVAKASWDSSRNSSFRIVDEMKSGLSNARLKAISEAKYDIVSFVDDDNLIPPNWIQYLSDVFQNQNIGVLGCTSVGKFDYQTPDWYENHKLSFATGELYSAPFSDVTNDGLVYGAGMTMRKEIFDKLANKNWKPFLSDRVGKKQSAGGDSELTLAARLLGYKIFYSNQIKTQHLITADRLTWERLKDMNHGFGGADVFILPYQYQFKKLNNATNLFDELRKKWWVNYLGKKLAFFNSYLSKLSGGITAQNFELIAIRNRAFCESIWQERNRFSKSFDKVKLLIN